jgi:CHAT domain-containing protein
MAEFYKNLWQNKLSKLEALRQAHPTMIHAYRRRVSTGPAGQVEERQGAPARGEADQVPPVYWAGFVLSGDWR